MAGTQRAGAERAGVREVGRTKDAGFQIGVRRTVPHPPATVWSALTSDVGLAAWLGSEVRDAADRAVAAAEVLEAGARFTTADGAEGEVRSVRSVDRIRARLRTAGRAAPTTVQVALLAAASGTAIVLHEEHLADAAEREERREHWRAVADTLAAAIEAHDAG